MQTQTQTETQVTPDTVPLEQQISAAQATLVKLEGAAADAETEAQRWQTAFEREPTKESSDNAVIWKQKAKNAQAAAEHHEQQVLWRLVSELKSQQFTKARSDTERQVEILDGKWAQARDAFVAAAAALDAAISEFEQLGKLRHAARALGYEHPAIMLGSYVERLSSRLTAALGTARTYPHTTRAVCNWSNSGNDPFIAIEIHRPLSAVPMVYR